MSTLNQLIPVFNIENIESLQAMKNFCDKHSEKFAEIFDNASVTGVNFVAFDIRHNEEIEEASLLTDIEVGLVQPNVVEIITEVIDVIVTPTRSMFTYVEMLDA